MGNFKLVRASAGSGKTYKLGMEYLSLALKTDDPFYFKRILGITFTNKAAGELKERVLVFTKSIMDQSNPTLAQQLQTRLNISEKQLQSRAKNLFEAILSNYSDFAILTIDKFIQKIVRGFSRELNLDSDFEVSLDEKEIWEKTIENLLFSYGSKTDNQLDKRLQQFGKRLIQTKDNWNIADELVGFCSVQLNPKKTFNLQLDLESWLKVKKDWEEKEKKFVRDAQAFIAACKSLGLDLADFKGGNSSGFLKKLTQIIARPHKPDFTKATAEKFLFTPENLFIKTKLHLWDQLTATQATSYFMNEYGPEKYKDLKFNRHILDASDSMDMVDLSLKEHESYCAENYVVPISEFGKLVSDVVCKEPVPFIYEKVGVRFHHFLIDEFQDTSVQEFQNFIPLIENGLAEGNETFLVGDAKQSIYRFKGGVAQQFVELPSFSAKITSPVLQEKQDVFQREFEADLSLDSNWRSGANVVSFNNGLFHIDSVRKLTAKGTQLAEWDQEAYLHSEQKVVEPETGLISLDFFVKQKEIKWKAEEMKERSVQWVLEKVQECLAAGVPPSSICILVDKNSFASPVAATLLENGIEVEAPNALELRGSRKLLSLIYLLRWVLSGVNLDLVKFTMLRCDIGEEQRLAELERVKKHNAIPEIDHAMASFSLSDYVSCLGLQIGLEPNDLFFQSFLSAVQAFEQNNGFDLPAFIHYWDNRLETAKVASGGSSNAVKISSMHKSKGLEFHTVIAPQVFGAGRNGSEQIWVEKDGTQALLKLTKALEGTEGEIHFKREASAKLADQLNLLYVVCTRAKFNLFLEFIKEEFVEWVDSFFEAEKLENFPTAQMGYWRKEQGTLHIPKVDSESEKNTPPLKINAETPTVVVASSIAEGESEALFGSELHQVMAALEGEGDLENVFKRIAFLSPKETLKKECEKILEMSRPYGWFAPGVENYAEREFLWNGNSIRPDRLVIQNEEVHVIDFKTGKPEAKHQNQISEYAQMCAAYFGMEARGYLLYSSEGKIEIVSNGN